MTEKGGRLDIRRLTPSDLAEVLRSQGSREVSVSAILKQTSTDGAPIREDGTVDFVEYLSWLVSKSEEAGENG